MADASRLDDLRRRVQQDPSSIAFAQLAEEYRRAAMFQEAVDVCRAGLAVHPGYVSARVTLGRALVELNQYEQAQLELEHVLKIAPENLAAIRGLADVLHKQGTLGAALVQYRAALAIVRHDPDLEQTIAELERQTEAPVPIAIVAAAPEPPPTTLETDSIDNGSLGNESTDNDAPHNEERTRAVATIAALEHLLTAVHVARAQRCA